MKSIISKTTAIVALAAIFFSFTYPGSEGFEIFLNNKVVARQFGKRMDQVGSLALNQQSPNDQLTVKYYHCGQTGTNRIITIKGAQNKILREWRFGDATASVAATVAMDCNLKDIITLSKKNETALKLYYSSGELPTGRLLINIVVASNSVAGK